MTDKETELRNALKSLVAGVEELQEAWPRLDLPSEGLHNDLIGFLFATLPIAQKALADTPRIINEAPTFAGIDALKDHIDECDTCKPHRGHMPLGFCSRGIELFDQV